MAFCGCFSLLIWLESWCRLWTIDLRSYCEVCIFLTILSYLSSSSLWNIIPYGIKSAEKRLDYKPIWSRRFLWAFVMLTHIADTRCTRPHLNFGSKSQEFEHTKNLSTKPTRAFMHILLNTKRLPNGWQTHKSRTESGHTNAHTLKCWRPRAGERGSTSGGASRRIISAENIRTARAFVWAPRVPAGKTINLGAHFIPRYTYVVWLCELAIIWVRIALVVCLFFFRRWLSELDFRLRCACAELFV